MKKLKIGILFGGKSAEHEISILSARNITSALDRNRFEPVLIGVDKTGRWMSQNEAELLSASTDPRRTKLHTGNALAFHPAHKNPIASPNYAEALDVVFPVLHGPMGEDGTVQGLLELLGIPYVGSGVLGSSVSMDKDFMKRLLHESGLPVPLWKTFQKYDFEKSESDVCYEASSLGFPLFTKPANMGSSIGVQKLHSKDALPSALRDAFEFDTKVIVEAGIAGREIECAVLGGHEPRASIPGEVIVDHPDGFYSYNAKYVDNKGARIEIPANLTPVQVEEVQTLAVKAFRSLDCHGMARVDFFLAEHGDWFVSEVNTIPGFTAISMYPKMWEASGVNLTELVTTLIDLALERHRERTALRSSYLG